jgi:hypothetical protein
MDPIVHTTLQSFKVVPLNALESSQCHLVHSQVLGIVARLWRRKTVPCLRSVESDFTFQIDLYSAQSPKYRKEASCILIVQKMKPSYC